MPFHQIPWSPTSPIPLPPGLVILQLRRSADSGYLLRLLAQHFVAEFGLPQAAFRLCHISVEDTLLGTHADPIIRQAHWRSLWQLLPESGESGSASLAQQIAELRQELLALEQSGDMQISDVASANGTDHRLALQHQLARIESELRREMPGLVDTPDAARQVTRLGEAQARIRQEYLTLQEQLKELNGRLESATGETRRLKKEEGRKVTLGGIFVLLGAISLMADGVPAHLRPLGWAVIALGILFAYVANRNASAKESPKEAQVRRQVQETTARLTEVDERLREADRQVRQYCASIGCTSPGQVLELQRRFDQRRAEKAELEAELQALALTGTEQESRGGVATLTRAEDLRMELMTLETEVQRRAAGQGLRRPAFATVLETANQWLRHQDGGATGLQWGLDGSQTPHLSPENSPSLASKVISYLSLRLALIASSEEIPSNLPLVLDDPLKLWDDDELTAGYATFARVARTGRQVIYITSRGVLLSAWRQASRAQGEALTLVELGDPPSNWDAVEGE
ncbi:MAG: hypothetical protein GEEBNDBF_00265 [bacterium]|nr:hypothetical protein [bacterium]